jgi:high frequency lysogenization protein
VTTNIYKRTIALGGLYQCVQLVEEIAWNGRVEAAPFAACIYSLFNTQPEGYVDVYGGIGGLDEGLKTLRSTLNRNSDSRSVERTRYSIMLIYLEKRLSKNPQKINHIKSGIEAAKAQLDHFEMTHINIISRLADIYQQSISSLGPKIMVKGEQAHLSNPDNASRIRALLLAGIRAVLLWRQAGGNRWRLLFERNTMIKEIDAILAHG